MLTFRSADKLTNAARKTQKVATMQHVGAQQLHIMGGASPGMAMGAMGGELFQGTMVVPDKAVGTVIGKKGSGLEAIRRQARTFIQPLWRF